MKKKLLSLFVATCLAVPLTLCLSACGDPHLATAEEWQNGITVEGFSSTNVDYRDGNYVLSVGTPLQVVANFKKVTSGGTTTYLKSTDNQYPYTFAETTESDYLSALDYYVSVINFVKNNFGSFEHKARGIYEFNASESEIKDEIDAIAVLDGNNQPEYIITVQKHRNFNGGPARFTMDIGEGNGYDGNAVDFIEQWLHFDFVNPVLSYEWETYKATFVNYVVKMCANDTSLEDYGEFYASENAFRLYTPNLPDPTRHDGYYCFDEQANKYYVYTQNASGVWSKTEIGETQYKNAREQVFDTYFLYILNGWHGCNGFMNNDGVITRKTTVSSSVQQSLGGYTHVYDNIRICVDGNGITGITWDYYIQQGNARSETIKFSVSPIEENAIVLPNA